MRIGTFNIYWFGTTRPIVERSVDDDALVARVLAGIDADVLALQEICDLPRLERVLAQASALGGRAFRCRLAEGVVTSARPNELTERGTQKVVLAWDAARVEPVAWGTGAVAALRPPLVARFRDRDGAEVDVVTVHLKSGRMGAPMEDPNAIQRHAEATGLAALLGGAVPWPAGLERNGRIVALGDLNASPGDPSLAPLWALPGWTWIAPEVPADDAWTAYIDRAIIDLAGVSPGLRVVAPPRAWAWDRDPRVAEAGFFQRVEGFVAQRARDFPRAPVENLYRVSDHRPVVVEVAPA